MRRTWNASKAVAAIVLLLLLFMPSAVHAQKRVALVIGNASYQYAPALATPRTMRAMWPLRCRDLAFRSSQDLI